MILLLISILFYSCSADMHDARGIVSNIRTLDEESFDAATANVPSFILFYAPWCGHSQRLMPTYEVVAATFHKQQTTLSPSASAAFDDSGLTSSSTKSTTPPVVLIGRVDVDKYRSFAKRFDLRGFPTMKYFASSTEDKSTSIKGKGVKYSQGVDATSIISYLNERAGTSYTLQQASTWVRRLVPKTFEAVALDPTKHVLIQFHAPWCTQCGTFADTWETVAKTFRSDYDSVVLASVNADKYRDLAQQQDVTSYPTIKYYPGYTSNNDDNNNDNDNDNDKDQNAEAQTQTATVEMTSQGNTNSLPESVDGAFARTYNGGMSSQELVSFINQVASLERVVGGDIHREAGRSTLLDESAGLFVAAVRSQRRTDVQQVRDAVANEKDRVCGGGNNDGHTTIDDGSRRDGSSDTDDQAEKPFHESSRSESLQCQGARLYGRVMDKVLAHVDGLVWASKELVRLETLIKDEDVNHLQRTRMMLRRNVLEAF